MSNQLPYCPICDTLQLRPDDHEIEPGQRCVPYGHVIIDYGDDLPRIREAWRQQQAASQEAAS